ncbi:imidazole glycerol phosphate synthase cyclase subunit [Pelagibacteraceae bacterium]|nr:imidazole glycerol phosphate synthase cyclase subunit [Pelagibacteraceae bacterium]
MKKIRLIGRLDIKGPNLIKGIHLEGLRVIGSPKKYALKYYLEGIDELLYMDTVATLYGRNNLLDFVKEVGKNIFIPMTVGGGIRSVEDAYKFLSMGADKVAINTAAVANPKIIEEISRRFGSQCLVLSVEAKKITEGNWEVYTNNGREKTGLDVVEWVREAESLGVGEILLTSIDQEGTSKGFDLHLVKIVKENTAVPLIASGGMGKTEDLVQLINECDVDAVAMANVLHKNILTIKKLKENLISKNYNIRKY